MVPGKRLLLWGAVSAAVFGAVCCGITSFPHRDTTTTLANPEDTWISAEVFRSAYFGMTLPLPGGWKLGATGHPPSQSGEYVLATLVSEGENTGTILITAQDIFFAEVRYRDTAAMIADFRRGVAELSGMKIDHEPSQERIGGRAMFRMDFNGVGLFRSMLAVDLRCHLIRFTVTAPEPEMLANLARALDNLSFDTNSDSSSAIPLCMKGYAMVDRTLRQVEPVMVGGAYERIPVRIIIGTDGGVKWVHAIHATADQRRSVEDAVRQWKFRPYVMNGRAREVETDLLFRVAPWSRAPVEGQVIGP
jgi:hypothetical protein